MYDNNIYKQSLTQKLNAKITSSGMAGVMAILAALLAIVVIVESVFLIMFINERAELASEDNSLTEEEASDYTIQYDSNNSIKSISTTCTADSTVYQFYISGKYDISNASGDVLDTGTYYFKNDSIIETISDDNIHQTFQYNHDYIKDSNDKKYNCEYDS